MGAKKSFYLLEPLQAIPINGRPDDDAASWLGRVVLDYRRPLASYTPREAKSPSFKYHIDSELVDVVRVIDSMSSRSLQLSFLDAAGVSTEDFKARTHAFTTRNVQRLRVHQDAEVLDTVVNTPAVVADLGEWEFGPFQTLYLVVGVLVTESISYGTAERDNTKFGAEVDPVKLASMATPGALLPVNTKVAGAVNVGGGLNAGTQATGARIFAVEYRSFRRRLVQRADSKVRLGPYGPQDERSFASADSASSGLEVHSDLDEEPFSEIIELDPEVERCFDLPVGNV